MFPLLSASFRRDVRRLLLLLLVVVGLRRGKAVRMSWFKPNSTNSIGTCELVQAEFKKSRKSTPFFTRLYAATNIRDGTGRDCFRMFGGKKNKTGRVGTANEENVQLAGRDGTGQWMCNFSTGRNGKVQR